MTNRQFDCVCAGIATWDTLFTGVDRDLMSIDGILAICASSFERLHTFPINIRKKKDIRQL